MDKPYYVILTGGKSNAGDYLIKYRAKQLLEEYRPDRDIIDFNAWEGFDDERLKIVNDSKALILLGGPSLQKNMYPGIYSLVDELSKIAVPVTTLGIGWKSFSGNWSDTYDYPLTSSSLKLLSKCMESGLPLSVRDYHTMNTLNHNNISNVYMTGCPAYYNLDAIEEIPALNHDIKKVAFSLGVSFIESPSMKSLMKEQILYFKDKFKELEFEVVFHHSLDSKIFMSNHGSSRKHVDSHIEFKKWLDENGVSSVDISGSADNLINYYQSVDLHIGYRVHAHIFMNSLGKLSVLISEDGRAKGSSSAIGGMVLDGYLKFDERFFSKVLNRMFFRYDRYDANFAVTKDIEVLLAHEFESGFQMTRKAGLSLKENYKLMRHFLDLLP